MIPEPPGVQITDYCEKTKTIHIADNLHFLLTHTYPNLIVLSMKDDKIENVYEYES